MLIGVWLSLVERMVRDHEAGGSNPLTPTILEIKRGDRVFLLSMIREAIMKILCIGDSLTKGFGVASKQNWVYLSSEKSGNAIINRGISGDTSGGMLARFYQEISETSPDTVMIMGGVNDLFAGCPAGVPQANIMAMVHQGFSLGLKVWLGKPPICDFSNFRKDWAVLINHEVRKNIIAYQEWLDSFSNVFQVPLVDFNEAFRKENFNALLYLDGIHPSQKGHRMMSDTFVSHIDGTKK